MRRLEAAGYERLLTRTHGELDLTDQAAVRGFFDKERPEYVFLAAARVGGILANSTYPADFIRDNLLIQSNVIDAACRSGVKKLLFLGSSCIYPKMAPQPMKEEHLLTGPLEPTNEWYAIAKIAGIKMCQAYRRQYGFRAISLMPTNLYGPGDNFDLETSHVLPALIRKFHLAKLASRGDGEGILQDEARFGPIPQDLRAALNSIARANGHDLPAPAPSGSKGESVFPPLPPCSRKEGQHFLPLPPVVLPLPQEQGEREKDRPSPTENGGERELALPLGERELAQGLGERGHALSLREREYAQGLAEREIGAYPPAVVLWGTGTPRREFLHVDDLADCCLFLMEHYDSDEIVNVGVGEDRTIRDLAGMVARIVGFDGAILFDASKPDGTPRKLLDVSRLTGLGWKPRIGLAEGIATTYEWYKEQAHGKHADE